MSASDGTPLATVPGWTGGLVERLAGHWVSTAEQVVGMAATPSGVGGLAELLGVSPAATRKLVAAAKAALPAGRAAALGRPADASGYGLGALPPRAD